MWIFLRSSFITWIQIQRIQDTTKKILRVLHVMYCEFWLFLKIERCVVFSFGSFLMVIMETFSMPTWDSCKVLCKSSTWEKYFFSFFRSFVLLTPEEVAGYAWEVSEFYSSFYFWITDLRKLFLTVPSTSLFIAFIQAVPDLANQI